MTHLSARAAGQAPGGLRPGCAPERPAIRRRPWRGQHGGRGSRGGPDSGLVGVLKDSGPRSPHEGTRSRGAHFTGTSVPSAPRDQVGRGQVGRGLHQRDQPPGILQSLARLLAEGRAAISHCVWSTRHLPACRWVSSGHQTPPHLTDEVTEAQRCRGTCPQSRPGMPASAAPQHGPPGARSHLDRSFQASGGAKGTPRGAKRLLGPLHLALSTSALGNHPFPPVCLFPRSKHLLQGAFLDSPNFHISKHRRPVHGPGTCRVPQTA